MKQYSYILSILIAICAFLIISALPQKVAQSSPQGQYERERPFYMGFSTWPPDLDYQAIDKSYELTNANSDMRLLHLDGGVPWVEMSRNLAIPKRIESSWDYTKTRTKNKKMFVAITPLNFERDGLALYANEKDDNQSLPKDWQKLALNSPQVKEAYLNYAENVISYWNPDYLAVGIEVNISLNKNKKIWEQYVDLHKYIYQNLKVRHPNLPVFATIQMEHFNGQADEAEGNEELQKKQVGALMTYCDIAALSMYPYSNEGFKLTRNYFDDIKSFGKPIAISETGWPSEKYNILIFPIKGSKKGQAEFLATLLEIGMQDQFVFVINWVNVDYNKMLDKLPWLLSQIAKSWVYDGLWDKDFQEKPALKIWQTYLGLHKVTPQKSMHR